MDDFGKMNETELRFAAYMASAPAEQQAHFRETLNQLMLCYAERPTHAILAAVIDKSQGTMTVTGINLPPEDMLLVATSLAEVIETNTAPAPSDAEVH